MFWAPDGQTIGLFGLGEGRAGGGGLHLFALPRGVRIAEHIQSEKPGWPLGFSAGGKEFIFALGDEKARVAVNLKTRAQRKVSSSAELAWFATAEGYDFSHDGAFGVYVAKEGAER